MSVPEVSSRAEMVEELLNVCRLSGETKRPNPNPRPRILIISSFEEAEYLSACEVFQLLLQPKLRIECEVVQDIPQMAACKPYAYYLVVLLFRGIFADQDFNKLLLYASAYSDASKRALEVVPVIADTAFDFLGIESLLNKDIGPVVTRSGGRAHQEKATQLQIRFPLPRTGTETLNIWFRTFFKRLEQSWELVPCNLDLCWSRDIGYLFVSPLFSLKSTVKIREISEVLRHLRTKLALPFTPLASEGLQQRQVAEIAMRVHRYQDPSMDPVWMTSIIQFCQV